MSYDNALVDDALAVKETYKYQGNEPFVKHFYNEASTITARPKTEDDAFFAKYSIKITGMGAPRCIRTFTEAGLPQYFLQEIEEAKFTEPTPIQCVSWPICLSGRDMIGVAQTGSGKTLAFLAPAMIHINHQIKPKRGDGPIVLVVTPTRELAVQIKEECDKFCFAPLCAERGTKGSQRKKRKNEDPSADGPPAKKVATGDEFATKPTPISYGDGIEPQPILAATDVGGMFDKVYQKHPQNMGLPMCWVNRNKDPNEKPVKKLSKSAKRQLKKKKRNMTIKSVCVYGGIARGPQKQKLESACEIIVCTPGRMLDFLEEGVTNLQRVTMLILDEADRMLDMGFEPQIKKIIFGQQSFRGIRKDRQTVMFTATWPHSVQKLAASLHTNPIQVNIGSSRLTANKDIHQTVQVVKDWDEKMKCLEKLLIEKGKETTKSIIFTTTKRNARDLERILERKGFWASAIHGDLQQWERDEVMDCFKCGDVMQLVATDVASRGLHVDDIALVVNFDFPSGVEDYVHRIGRTGRAGKKGEAVTYFTRDDSKKARQFVTLLKESEQYVPPELVALQRPAWQSGGRRYGGGWRGRGRRGNRGRGGFRGRGRGGRGGWKSRGGGGGYKRSGGYNQGYKAQSW